MRMHLYGCHDIHLSLSLSLDPTDFTCHTTYFLYPSPQTVLCSWCTPLRNKRYHYNAFYFSGTLLFALNPCSSQMKSVHHKQLQGVSLSLLVVSAHVACTATVTGVVMLDRPSV